ncbi:hypothetical protein [Salininema proteolyticum]|uniref:Uncharacterized protein n=1 Tax=Salininema proteolyticum TaxID=1607685 RepID=A0ABV8TZL3_9ACTN
MLRRLLLVGLVAALAMGLTTMHTFGHSEAHGNTVSPSYVELPSTGDEQRASDTRHAADSRATLTTDIDTPGQHSDEHGTADLILLCLAVLAALYLLIAPRSTALPDRLRSVWASVNAPRGPNASDRPPAAGTALLTRLAVRRV